MNVDLIEQRTPSGNAYLSLLGAGGTLLAIAHGWRDSPQAWQWVIASLQGRDDDRPLDVIAIRRRAGQFDGSKSPALLEA